MKTRHPSLLEILPYPLLPPHRKYNQVFYGHCASPGPGKKPAYSSYSVQEESHFIWQRCRQEIIKPADFLSSEGEIQIFIRQNQLTEICFDMYCHRSIAQTPLLKATAISLYLSSNYLKRGRLSRNSAAWIWGYNPEKPGTLHIDFDRNQRINITRAKRKNITCHQVRVLPYDFISLGALKVTTPLRTAIDLLLNDHSDLGQQTIKNILSDRDNQCSVQQIQATLDHLPYVKHKKRALERLKDLEKDRLLCDPSKTEPPAAV